MSRNLIDSQIQSVTVWGITPLYGFSTDSEPLIITQREKITESSEENLRMFRSDDDFLHHIRLFRPDHLLWTKLEFDRERFLEIVGLAAPAVGSWTPDSFENFVRPVRDTLRALHLFRPGRLVAGDTSFFIRTSDEGSGSFLIARCSEMSIDFQYVHRMRPSYQLPSAEVAFFVQFLGRFSQAWIRASQCEKIDYALMRYARESSTYGEAVELMISLESLLVPETERIKFRLAQRVANLLDSGAADRKDRSAEIRKFYNVRSKIVHGERFEAEHFEIAKQLDSLREITRRILLSVIAIAEERPLDQRFYSALDEMCFDDDLRRSFQQKAASLLHC